MRIGLVGLGRMGANMARRLRRAGIEVVAQNRDARVAQALAAECGVPAPVISAALQARFVSQGDADSGARLLAVMRKAFGAHAVTREP